MEGKKAFVVYTNWKEYIDDLTDEQVGAWTRWMFDYTNDKWDNKEIKYPSDAAVKVLCKLTKDILKQDLDKYKQKKKRIDEINERKRNKVDTKSENIENEIDHDIVNENENEIDHSNKLLVISNKILSKDNNIVSKDTLAEVDQNLPQPFIKLPLIKGTHPVYEDDIKNYKNLYPAVDIEQQLRNMLGWLDSNPKNRKTATGIKSFITRWLSKCQDKAPKQQESYMNYDHKIETVGDEYLPPDYKMLPNESAEEYNARIKAQIVKNFRK